MVCIYMVYIVGLYDSSRQIYIHIATPIRIPYKIPNKIIRKSKKNRSDDETENYSTIGIAKFWYYYHNKI